MLVPILDLRYSASLACMLLASYLSFGVELFSTVVSGTALFELCDAVRGFEMTAGARLAGKCGNIRG